MVGKYYALNLLLWVASIALVLGLWLFYYVCPFFFRRRGALFFKERRFLQASRCFRRALFFSARDDALWFSYALAQRRISKLDDAANALLKAVSLEPMDAQVYFECADVLSALGKHTDALRVLEEPTLMKRPTTALVLTRAAIELEARRFNDVEHDCQWLLREGNDLVSAQAYCILGIMRILTGRTEEGEYDLDVSYLLDPKSSITRAYCAAILYHRGMNRQTIRLCDSIIRMDPYCPIAYYYRGVAYRKLGELQAGDADLAKSQQMIEGSSVDVARGKDRFFTLALGRVERAIANWADDIT